MVGRIIGGAVVVIIGGTTFAISKTDVAKNFSKNTGLSQQQAEQYINSIPQKDIQSFSTIGQSLIDDAKTVHKALKQIDCTRYTYKWESPSLSCSGGKGQLQTTGEDEVVLGNCFQALGTDLGSSATDKIQECITDIDTLNSDYDLPILTSLIDNKTLTDTKNRIIYNKSILQAALNAH